MHGTWEYPKDLKLLQGPTPMPETALNLRQYFYLLMEKALVPHF